MTTIHKQTRTRIRIDLVLSHVPMAVDANAERAIIDAIAYAARAPLGVVEPGAVVSIEDADTVPAGAGSGTDK